MPDQKNDSDRQAQPQQAPKGAFPCEQCGFPTRDDIVNAAVWRREGLIAIEGIPARVCEACGEHSYDQRTARRLESVIAQPPAKAGREILVPVFSLSEVETPERTGRTEALDEEEMEALEATFAGAEHGGAATAQSPRGPEGFLCKHCGSETREDIVQSALWTDKGLVAVEDVPARVCEGCKEQFYDDETIQKIDKLIERGFPPDKATRKIVVPVFSLEEVEVS